MRYIEDNMETEDDSAGDDFEKDFFVKHNIMKECTMSYVYRRCAGGKMEKSF